MFNRQIKSIKLFQRKEKRFYRFLVSVTGIRPRNIGLYHQAFLHKSHHQLLGSDAGDHNERLEFLGDAIMGAVVAHELFVLFPQKDEGFLTKTRARIVNRSNMDKIAREMGLHHYISFHPPGTMKHTHVPGDALEALIGAIFIDKGYSKVRKFIRKRILAGYLNFHHIVNNDTNYKSMLIEWGQKHRSKVHFVTEEYPVTDQNGPLFVASAVIDAHVAGKGKGTSKKEAQQEAAHAAINKFGISG